jgi:hypothetical protein
MSEVPLYPLEPGKGIIREFDGVARPGVALESVTLLTVQRDLTTETQIRIMTRGFEHSPSFRIERLSSPPSPVHAGSPGRIQDLMIVTNNSTLYINHIVTK